MGRAKRKPSTYRADHKTNGSRSSGGANAIASSISSIVSQIGSAVGSGIRSGASSAGIPISGGSSDRKPSKQEIARSIDKQYKKVMKTASSGKQRHRRDRSRTVSDTTAQQTKTAAEQIQERNSKIRTSADYRTQYEEPYTHRLRANQEKQDRERTIANTYHAKPEDSPMVNYAKTESIIRHQLRRQGEEELKKADKDAASRGMYIPESQKAKYRNRLDKKAGKIAAKSVAEQDSEARKAWNKEDHYKSLGDRISDIVLGSTEQSIGQYGRFIPEVMTVASSGKAGKSGTAAHRGGMDFRDRANPNRVDKLQEEADRIRKQQYLGSVGAGQAASRLIAKGTEKADRGMQGLSGGGKFAAEALQGATQLAIDLGIGAATGLGMAPMGLRAAGGEVDNAIKNGASRKQALASAAAVGGVEMLTEKIGNMGSILRAGFGKGVADDVVDNLLGKIAQKAASQGLKDLTHVSGRWLTAAAEEGLEEVIAEAVEPGLANAIYDAGNATIFSDPEQALADWAHAGALGAVLGGVAGGGGVVAQHRTGSNIRRAGMVDDMMARAVNVDDEADAATAQGLKAVVDSGKSLTSLQVEKLSGIVAKQQQANNEKMDDAVRAATTVMARHGYSAPKDDGIRIQRGEDTALVAEDLIAAQHWGEDTAAVRQRSGEIADRMARLETGEFSNADVDTILSDPVQRTIYEQVTGVELPKAPSEARNAIYVRAADGLVAMAQTQTELDRNDAYQKLVKKKEGSFGAQGQGVHNRLFADLESRGVDRRDNDAVSDLEKAFEIMYNGGKNDYKFSELRNMFRDDPRFQNADVEFLNAAYNAGQADGKAQVRAAARRQAGILKADGNTKGRLITTNLSEENTPSIEMRLALESIARMTGNDIVLEDKLDNDVEGFYDNREIHIAANVKRPILSILTHEITHFIEDFAPEAWADLRNYVVANAETIYGVDINTLIENKIKQYADAGIKLDREGAIKEIIANTPKLYTDGSIIKDIVEANRPLGVRILMGIREALRKIRAAIAENSAADTRWLRADLEAVKQAERLWTEALAKAAENRDAVEVRENKGSEPQHSIAYHAGDLGKSESLFQQSGGRSTGHFGTGTYFVGNVERLKGYNTRSGKPAPIETVEFDNYNLYKPKNTEEAYKLHDSLKFIDYYYGMMDSPYMDKDVVSKVRARVEDIDNRLQDVDGEFNRDTGEFDPTEFGQFETNRLGEETRMLMEENGMGDEFEKIVGDDFDGNYTDRHFLEMFDTINDNSSFSWAQRAGETSSDLQKVDEVADFFGMSRDDFMNTLREIHNETKDIPWTKRTTEDSAATRFMKRLGYEGVDVRHTDLDNTTYGSVIYDLKGEDLARKNEIGTARFSIASDEDYMAAVKRGDMEAAQRMVDEAAEAAGYTYTGYHGTNAEFNRFDPEKLGSKNWMAGSARLGFFASKSRETAETYTGLNSADMIALHLNKDVQATMERIKEEHGYQEAYDQMIKERDAFFEDFKYGNGYKEDVDDMLTRLEETGAYDEFDDETAEGLRSNLRRQFEYTWNDSHLNDMYAAWESSPGAVKFKELEDEIFAEWEQTEIKRRGYKPQIKSLRIKMDNPFVYDFKGEGRDAESFAARMAKAKEDGHDGCIFLNVADGADVDDIYTVFDNTQFKSADPVTYDDAGNVIPLSQRFNTETGDIRYSVSDAFESGDVNVPRFSLREGDPPKKIKGKIYKLFKLYPDGSLGALFIDKGMRLDVGKWYNADSPAIKDLEDLETGHTYFVDGDGNAELREFKTKTGNPGKKDIEQATIDGGRLILVDTYKDGRRKYHNWGINGSGSVSSFAMRPGWHATDAPSARHIGAGKNGAQSVWRREDEVWAEISLAADNDYQAEAEANPEKDIQTHIPTDGYYYFKTNTNAGDDQSWYISGAIKIDRLLSDDEATQIAEQNGVTPDLPRESGRKFDPENTGEWFGSEKRLSIADDDYLSVVKRGDMATAQEMVDRAAVRAGLHKTHFFHGTLNASFTIFDKMKATVGGNSGAGFYFSTNIDDSTENYSDVEGADNYFKASHLADQIMEDGEWQGEEIEDYDRALEIAKEELQKKPGVFDVYLKYDNPYIRNYRYSTDIFESIMDGFDESVVDRDDYDDESDYEDALVEERDNYLYNEIYAAVYKAVSDLESNYEEVFVPDVETIAQAILTAAVETDSLTWDDIHRCFEWDDISVLPYNGVDTCEATSELTRAIIEAFGYDAIEDMEVGTKFNQLIRGGMEDAMHVIVFHPSQIKLSDPVTYDDAGDPISLSQRFDTTNNDMRYSIAEVESNLRESIGPRAQFGVGTDPNGNIRYSIPTEINAHIKGDGRTESVRNLRHGWMINRKRESKALDTVLDRIGDFMTGASDLYEYLSLDNVKNATVTYRTDEDGNPTSVILSCQVANGEYEVNFDFTTICKKRESFQRVIEDLYKEGVDEIDLTEENIFAINQELQGYGFETACPICFVEARRYANKAYAEKIVNTWNAAVDKVNPNAEYFDFANADINDFDYEAIDKALKNTGIKGKMNFEKKVDALVRSGAVFQKKLQQSDILTNKGVEALKAMSNEKNSLFGYLKQSRGASAPKEIVAFNAYNGEIELLPKTMGKDKTPLAEYLTSIAGARLQSFSDFQIENMYDYMQLIAGMAARKIPAHAYTKEIAFARLFGMTGMKINMSIVCDVDPNVPKEYAGLTYDENGELVYNFSEQTFPWEEAVALQKDSRYSKNVGTILVGMSDAHILKALNDPDIRFIIPYHKSGLPKPIMKSTHLGKAKDYTKFQNTCKLSDNGIKALKDAGYETDIKALYEKMGAKKALKYLNDAFAKIGLKDSYVVKTGEGYGDFDLYGDIQETKNPRKTASNYIEDCMKRGDLPLFFQFAGHKNYYKTLYDFDVYDSVTGRYAPQGAVRNVYPGMDITKGETDTTELESIATEYLNERNEVGEKTSGKYADVMTEIKSNVFDMAHEETPTSERRHSIAEKPARAEATSRRRYSAPDEDDVWSWLADNNDGLDDADPSEIPVYDQMINLSRARRVASMEELSEAAKWIRKENETKLTHGRRLDARSVKERMNVLIRELMVNSDSSARTKNAAVKQAVAAAQAIYPHLINEDYDAAANIAYDVALDIIEQIDIVNDEMYMTYAELRDYFRTTKIWIPEQERGSDYNDLRKKNVGRLRISNSGIELDKIWDELCGDFPGVFNPETNGMDRLAEIDSVLDSFSDFHEEYTSQEMDELASLTAGEIMNIAYEGKPERTFADKKKEVYDRRTKALKERHREAMAAYREKEKARREKAIKEEREKKKAAVEKEKARGEEKLRQQKEKQKQKEQKKREAAAKKKANDRLENHIAWLSERLLKPTDEKHIPEGYRQAVAQLLAALDTQTERSRKLEEKYGISKKRFAWLKLKQEYQKIAEGESYGFVLDEGLVSIMDELSEYLEDKNLSDANSEQLDLIRKLVAGIRHGIAYQNKAFSDAIKEQTDALGRQTMEDTEEKINKYGGRDGRARADWWFLNESMATPRDYFEGIGSGMNVAFMALRAGMDTHVRDVDFIRNTFTDIFGKYAKKRKPGSELEKWRDDTQTTEFTLESGETIKLNPSQIMSLYCLMQREQAIGHILGSGIIASDVSTKQKLKEKIRGKAKATRGRRVTVTLGDITQIVSSLTEDQREMATKMQDLLNGTIAEWGNETSMKMNGYRKFEEKNYFPIQVEKTYLATDFDVTKAPERVKNPNFSKSTVKGASNPVVIADIFSVVADHCNAMSMYRSFAPAIADFQRIYNHVERDEEGRMIGSVKETLKACYGQHALQYIETFMTDLNGTTPKSKEALTAFINKSLANYKKAAIGFNMRVALQQPTAIIRAMMLISPKYFVTPKNPRQAVREMKEHCPIALWKSWGFNNVDMARSMEEIMMNQEWSRTDVITMEIYGALDTMTWGQIWGAVKAETKAKHPDVEVGSQEFWDLCNERASEVFDKTQVVDSVFHRSQVMRSTGALEKLMTSFMAEPTRTFNMVWSQMREAKFLWKDGQKAKATAKANRALTVYIANAALVSMAAAVADALRGKGAGDGDDDDKGWADLYWANFIQNFIDNANPLGLMPLAKDVISMVEIKWDDEEGLQIERGYGTQFMALEGLEKLMYSFADWTSDKKSLGEKVRATLEGAGYVFGVPTANIFREFDSMMNFLGAVFATEKGEDGSDNFVVKLTEKAKELYDIKLGGKESDDKPSGEEPAEDGGKYKSGKYADVYDEIEQKTEGLSGYERQDKIWDIVTEGYTSLCTRGDYKSLKKMRKILEKTGGDVNKFDEAVLKWSKSGLKKNISDSIDYGAVDRITNYLKSSGLSKDDISEVIKGSDAAKGFQKALQDGDKEAERKYRYQLIAAGLTFKDVEELTNKAYKKGSGTFQSPIAGDYTITSHFGARSAPTRGASSYHPAIDIGVPVGTPVRAADSGKVVYTGSNGGYGISVGVDHGNGYVTYYNHLSGYGVKKGDYVRKGQEIAKSGNTGTSTGPHLDFKILKDGKAVDPEQFLR